MARAQVSWASEAGARPHFFTSFDKEVIAFYTLGEHHKPAVVLLHGFTSSSESWFKCGLATDLVDAGYFVVAMDIRGHGLSARPVDAAMYTKQQGLHDIVALANQLKLCRFAVVGYSHGSIEAAKLLTTEERVACAVLGGVGHCLADKQWHEEYGVNTLALILEARARGKDLEQTAQAANISKNFKCAEYERLIASMNMEENAGEDESRVMLAFAGVQRGQSVSSPEELSKIDVPVLCLSGKEDQDTGDPKRLIELIPGSQLAWVMGDHVAAVSDPAFSQHILAFLKKYFPCEVAPHNGNESSIHRIPETSQGPPAKKQRTHLNPQPACMASLMSVADVASITIDYHAIENGLRDLIAEKGVAIVTGVLGHEDILDLEAAIKEDMEELVDCGAIVGSDCSIQAAWERVKREGLHSWPAASLADVGARGRFQDHGMPHGRFSWKSRTHPHVKRVYEVLHGTTDMVVSIDNAFVANASQTEVSTNSNWPHVDQNDNDTRVPCKDWDVYQGLLYVWSSIETHASTTVVWPESHKAQYIDYMSDPNLQRRIAAGKPHFSLISALAPGETRDRLIRGWEAEARRMPIPAGGLLLFTSRTTHQGWSGGPRLAQPLCWEPRARRDEIMRERKMRLAALGLPSTHWASLALPHELSDLCRPSAVHACGSVDYEKIRFPMKREIRSQALAKEADLDILWQKLIGPDWYKELPQDLKALLEKSISADYKGYL